MHWALVTDGLGHHQPHNEPPASDGKLTNLKWLGLFKDGHEYVLESLPAGDRAADVLTHLDLHDNQLTNFPQIGQLTSLTFLNLVGNHLTEA